MKRERRKFSAAFKTKVVLEAIKERETIQQLASKYEVHPAQISQWKSEFLSSADQVFGKSKEEDKASSEQEKDALYMKIGRLEMEIDFLKKVLGK